MSNRNKNDICRSFYESFTKLTDAQKINFSRLCNKIFNDNFIYKGKKEDKEDYMDILSMKPIFEDYFALIDYDLIHRDIEKVIYIQTNADRNRIRLKKLDTVIILVLRLLYYNLSKQSSLSNDISTTLENLNAEINKTNIYPKRITVTDYTESLRLLKRYKIIDYSFKEFNPDNVITIYPTILSVVKIDDIDMMMSKLDSYKINNSNKEDYNDEISED